MEFLCVVSSILKHWVKNLWLSPSHSSVLYHPWGSPRSHFILASSPTFYHVIYMFQIFASFSLVHSSSLCSGLSPFLPFSICILSMLGWQKGRLPRKAFPVPDISKRVTKHVFFITWEVEGGELRGYGYTVSNRRSSESMLVHKEKNHKTWEPKQLWIKHWKFICEDCS